MVEFTEWAREVVERSIAAAKRFNPDATVRLSATSGGLTATLTDAPAEGDAVVRVGEHDVFVAEDVTGLVDVQEPHDRLVLRAPGSEPNARPAS